MKPIQRHVRSVYFAVATAILLALCVAFLAAGCPEQKTPAEPTEKNPGFIQPSFLLISMDTLRARELGCYGCRDCRTPNIDRLAAQGALFERTITTCNWTLPAHASMLTGLYPATTGVRGERDRLADEFVTLAEHLREKGYATAAFTGGGWLDEAFGLHQGFDHFDPTSWPGDDIERRNRRVLEWMRAQPEGPFFVFYHTYQVHRPYTYHEGFPFPESPGGGPAKDENELPKTQWRAAYSGEVSYADHHLGALLDAFEKLRPHALVVLTADHGEAFGEHGVYEHGKSLYDEELVVPWIVKMPGVVQPGTRFARQASLVDIVPTVINLLGFPPPDGVDGLDVWSPGPQPDPPERTAYADTGPYSYNLLAAGTRRGKLILDGNSGGREFYLLESDPGETNNLLAGQPPAAASLDASLTLRYLFPMLRREPAPKATDPPLDKLKALGYVAD